MNTKSAFTGSYTEFPFWYQQFDLRQFKKFKEGQPIVYVTRKAMNLQDDIASIPIDNFGEHYVLVFQLTSMQDATEKCPDSELVGEPLMMELNITFSVEDVTELIVMRERQFQVQLTNLVTLGKISKMDNVPLQQIINRIPLLKYRYFGYFPSDYVPIPPNETFAIIYRQSCFIQGKYWIIVANSCHKLHFADSLGGSILLKHQYKQMMPKFL